MKKEKSFMEAIFGLGPNDTIKLDMVKTDKPDVLKLKSFKIKKGKKKK